MQTQADPDRRVRALLAALSLNRGEIDAARLARLLRLLETSAASQSAPS